MDHLTLYNLGYLRLTKRVFISDVLQSTSLFPILSTLLQQFFNHPKTISIWHFSGQQMEKNSQKKSNKSPTIPSNNQNCKLRSFIAGGRDGNAPVDPQRHRHQQRLNGRGAALLHRGSARAGGGQHREGPGGLGQAAEQGGDAQQADLLKRWENKKCNLLGGKNEVVFVGWFCGIGCVSC